MTPLIAWVLYFTIWAVSFMSIKIQPNKVQFAIMGIIALADVVYLAIYDLRALVLVIVATVFTVMGCARALAVAVKMNQ